MSGSNMTSILTRPKQNKVHLRGVFLIYSIDITPGFTRYRNLPHSVEHSAEMPYTLTLSQYKNVSKR